MHTPYHEIVTPYTISSHIEQHRNPPTYLSLHLVPNQGAHRVRRKKSTKITKNRQHLLPNRNGFSKIYHRFREQAKLVWYKQSNPNGGGKGMGYSVPGYFSLKKISSTTASLQDKFLAAWHSRLLLNIYLTVGGGGGDIFVLKNISSTTASLQYKILAG